MPIYEPDHVEYATNNSYIQIVLDGGDQLPAYLAHPALGGRYPGVVLIHDWWGLNDMVRRLGNLFAQMGYYVIVPDLFKGKTASSAREAMTLVESLGEHGGYPLIHSALGVLENHHQCNANVAAIGIGMGGSLAFEAAITRDDLEAAVAYAGFPQRCFGRFADAKATILAFYGEDEPHITPTMINKLRGELAASPLQHRVQIAPGIGHEFFSHSLSQSQRQISRDVLKDTLDFLDNLLAGPTHPPRRPVI